MNVQIFSPERKTGEVLILEKISVTLTLRVRSSRDAFVLSYLFLLSSIFILVVMFYLIVTVFVI